MTVTTLTSGTDDPPAGGTTDRDAGAEPLRPAWRPRRRGMARWAPIVATLLVIVGVIAVTLWQLHLNLLLSDTSTTGGDTGAHYMMPAYFTSDLFPHLTGWDPAWYDGYPIYTFYFVLPDALVALASHVITYNVAFKLATVLGSVLLPIAAWACGRLFRLRPPIPAALAAVTLPFLFDYTYTIYGGNLFSTLAGEYAYSLSIALAVLFLGLMARGLRTGRHRTWAAVVLALCIVSHIVPAMLALVGAGLLTAFELLPERLRLHDDATRPSSAVARAPGREGVRGRWPAVWWGVSTTAIGVLLSGWWLVPFGIRQPYSTSMGYANVTTYATLLFPHADLWALVLAGVAVVVAVVRRSRFGLLFGLLGGLSAVALIVDPQASLYNVRFLPLWFLCVYLMAGWVFGVGVAAAARWWRRARLARWVWAVRSATEPSATDPAAGDAAAAGHGAAAGDAVAYGWWRRPPSARWAPGAVGGALLALFGALLVVVPPFIPAVASALPDLGITPGANEVKNWAEWNYTGYEGKADYPEYRAVVELMAKVGRKYGCGRAMWEYNADENRFGTPEALMLLPYWTNGCVDSMEGLLFESSTTTPFHFLNQAELSPDPSEPMVGLPYGSLDIPLGIQHLQMLGVKYFMAASSEVEQAANADPSLKLVGVDRPVEDGLHRPVAVDDVGRLRGAGRRARHAVEQRAGGVAGGGAEPGHMAGQGRARRRTDGRAVAGLVRRPGPLGRGADGRRFGIVAEGDRRHRGCRAGRRGAQDDGYRHQDDRQLDQLPRQPGRRAGDGEDVVLPELAGDRSEGPVAVGAEPDGRRPDQPRRHAHVRHDQRQPARRRRHRARRRGPRRSRRRSGARRPPPAGCPPPGPPGAPGAGLG